MSNSDQVAQYFADLLAHFEQKGIQKVIIFLDQNPTHKSKMQNLLKDLMKNSPIKYEFHFIAPYSPKLNLVEYAIHLIRQKVLHHADAKKTLNDFESEIKDALKNQQLLSEQNIINILAHIENIIRKS